jgi:hypothetical protein
MILYAKAAENPCGTRVFSRFLVFRGELAGSLRRKAARNVYSGGGAARARSYSRGATEFSRIITQEEPHS